MDTINILGVTDGSVMTHGTTKAFLNFENISIETTFHVVDSEFPIPSDGIIGKDFIQKHFCKLDYFDMTFTVRCDNFEITVPIRDGPDKYTIAIPPRCEVFRCFHIQNFNEPCLIDRCEISPGIFTSPTIAYNNSPLIRILNTTTNATVISNKIETAEKLENYRIFSYRGEQQNDERGTKLREKLSEKVPKMHKNRLLDLCVEYNDIFALENDTLTVNNFYKQKLRLKDDSPVFTRNYRLPMTQKEEINKQVQNLISNDLIEPSHSCYNSPILLVPKKGAKGEKKWRMVIDYRQLNSKLIPDKFPLPRIDDILDSLGNAKYFTILDLFSGFHQIELDKNSRELTAFSTDKGIYQWRVLPFGLNIAPNAFCRMMQIAFSGLGPERCFIYMDDIIVIGRSEDEHLQNLRSVFKICREKNLKLNPEKVDFFRHEVTFLGHKCTQDGILPDKNKIESVKKYPVPKNAEETKRFTAFVNYYRRFIKNLSTLVKPLNKLTGTKTPFIWSDECQKAFETVKEMVVNPPILQYPDYNKEFVITVDASLTGCGAVLSQDKNGHDLPIHFASRAFEKGELNKDIVEKELLAIHFAITIFEPYIFGKHFTVRSDHKPLISLYKLKNPTGKLARIKLALSDKDFTIEHIPGKQNVVADALSRLNIKDIKNNYENDVTMFRLAKQISKINRIKNQDLIEIFEKIDQASVLPIQTRAMKRKIEEKKEKSVDKERENSDIAEVKIYEEMIDKKDGIPIIKTRDNSVCAYHNNNKISELRLDNFASDTIPLELHSWIDSLSGKYKLNEVKWPLSDEIFKRVDVNQFVKECQNKLNKIKIRLTPPILEIKNEEEKRQIMEKFHDDPLWGGHSGQKKLLSKIKSQYKWRNIEKDVANYVKNCEKCLTNKVKSSCKAPMMITPTPSKTMEVIIIDTLGPLPETKNGNKYAITMICDLSKYVILAPAQDKSAKTVARVLFERLIAEFGPIRELRSDRGTEFVNETLKELSKILNFEQKISTAYHHETVGSIERNHRTFNEYARIYISDMSEWDEYLPHFQFCYNINKSGAFGDRYSPFEIMFGKRAILNSINVKRIDPIYNVDDYVKELKYRLQKCHGEACKIIEKMKQRNKEYYDRKCTKTDYRIGDKFLIKKEPYNKFNPIYTGPYKIIALTDQNLTYYDDKDNIKTIHKNRTVKI